MNTEPGMPRDLAGLLNMTRSPLIAGSDTPMHPGRLAHLQRALEAPGLASLEYLYVLSERLPRARAAVADLMQEKDLDALVLPTMLCPAASLWSAYDTSYDCDVDDPKRPAYLASAAGLPEITLPMGFMREGLPLGLSLVGAAYDEPRLLALAYAFEQATAFRRPPDLKPVPEPKSP
jgi:amidase